MTVKRCHHTWEQRTRAVDAKYVIGWTCECGARYAYHNHRLHLSDGTHKKAEYLSKTRAKFWPEGVNPAYYRDY